MDRGGRSRRRRGIQVGREAAKGFVRRVLGLDSRSLLEIART